MTQRGASFFGGFLAAVTLAFVCVPLAQAAELKLTNVGSVRFPDRAFVLTLPEEMALDPSSVRVLENGKAVPNVSVLPATIAGTDAFGVVIVIDASRSMRGEPIKRAMEAAQVLAAQRNPQQKIAVVLFSDTTSVLLPFTTDAAEVSAALGKTPMLSGGTHIYDGVDKAAQLLEQADMTAGSIVVLTDGADTGSSTTLTEAARAAERAQARVFTVGLRSRAYRPATLKAIAEQAGGNYAEVSSPKDLVEVYDRLGAQLANEHLIRYRSFARTGENVQVEIVVEGVEGSVTSSYDAPALPTKPSGPYHPSFESTLWRSPMMMVLASLVASCLLVGALFALFGPRKTSLRTRMAGFVSAPPPEEQARRTTALTGKVLQGAEKSLERTRWWTRFKEELEIAQIGVPAIHLVVVTATVTGVLLWLVYALAGPLFAPLALVVPLFVRSYIKRKLRRRRQMFAEQLPDNLQVLASALRAGHSFVGALSVVVDDSPSPSREEFRRVVADEQLGVPLQTALDEVSRRMDNRDLEQVSLVASLQRETGGNTAEVLDRVTDTVRERFELRRLVRTLTAQGRMSRWIVSALPVFLLVAITVINPGYMDPLYTESVGRVILLVAGLLVAAGCWVIGRIVDIKV